MNFDSMPVLALWADYIIVEINGVAGDEFTERVYSSIATYFCSVGAMPYFIDESGRFPAPLRLPYVSFAIATRESEMLRRVRIKPRPYNPDALANNVSYVSRLARTGHL
jgi:hypothetical protein